MAEFEALVGLRPALTPVRGPGTRRTGPRPPPASVPGARDRAAVVSTTVPSSRRGRRGTAVSQSSEMSGPLSRTLDADTGDIFDILSRLEAETTGVLSGAASTSTRAPRGAASMSSVCRRVSSTRQHPNSTQLPSTEQSSTQDVRANRHNNSGIVQSTESLPVSILSLIHI